MWIAQEGPLTESASSSSSYSSMSVLMLPSWPSLSSSSQPTKNLGAPRWLSPGLLGSDITVPRGSPQRPTAPSYTNTPPERPADGRARGLGRGADPLSLSWAGQLGQRHSSRRRCVQEGRRVRLNKGVKVQAYRVMGEMIVLSRSLG